MRRAKLFKDHARKEYLCDVWFHGFDHSKHQDICTWAIVEYDDGTLDLEEIQRIQFIDPPSQSEEQFTEAGEKNVTD